jgi:flagellin
MDEISNMLQRMRELALQASNDTNSDNDRESLNLEIDALMNEIDRVVSTTAHNGRNILDGSAELNFQIGSEAGQNMSVDIASMGTNALGSLTGAPGANANLTSTTQGTAAEVTEVKMAFNSDDTYSFNLVIGTNAAIAISGDVSNSAATDITGAINTALANADLDEYASATFSGGVVTIKDTSGAGIAVNTFASVGNGTASYTTINGGAASDEVVNLGGATANTGTTFGVTAANTQYVAAADATTGTAAVFTELLDTSANGNFTDVTSWVVGDFGSAPAAADHLEVDFGDFSVTVAIADATDVGTFAQAVNAEQSAFTFSAVISDAGGGVLNYSLKAVSNSVGAVAVADVPTIKAIDADGRTITDGAFGNGTALTQTTAGVDAADAVVEAGGSKLFLELTGNDDYAFTITEAGMGPDVDLSFSYTGTSASRDAIAQTLETDLNAAGTSTFSVENVDGRLEITNQANLAMTLSAFTSSGTGTVLASTEAADAGAQGTSQLLDDNVNAVAATTTTAGAAVATVAELSFTAADTYSFNISDGTRTAVVDATAIADVTDAADMLAAINYGLSEAGMDGSITAAEAAGTITLTQAAGREISISNFSSDATGSMLVDAGAGTNGGSSYLNDGLGANSSTVSSISILTASKASDALEIIDRALQDVSSERAALGAVSNRLDHTISNLGNIVINTEASQSRIEDADFAKVTGDLTKAQIMSQAATAMLAQANASKQGVLSLLQG